MAVAGLICAATAGCGETPSVPTGRSPVAVAQSTHEYPAPAPPPERTSGGYASPLGAVDAFAEAYINWTAETVSADMRGLAGASVGPARSAMELAAGETAGDYELQRAGIANRGDVEAVASLRGHPDEYVVVTRELTTAAATTAYQGLAPAWHLAIATVAELSPGVWAISGWQPEG